MNSKVFDRFRDPELGKKLVKRIDMALEQLTGRLGRKVCFMEVCGTHTVAISRSGIRDLLADRLDLRSGPGCPVCVTDQADIDYSIALSGVPDSIVTTFGDMMRVPGTRTTLAEEKAAGRDVRVVYSPADAVEIAKANPGKNVVFLGVGFETTAPTVALAIDKAEREKVDNFVVLSLHKLVPPVMKALLSSGERGVMLDGFLLPGHVSTIIGRSAYRFLSEDFGMPGCIAGFEPLDILAGIDNLLQQMLRGKPEVSNAYPRAVREDGNRAALDAMDRFFVPVDASWRGLGRVPESGLGLRKEYGHRDTFQVFQVEYPPSPVKPLKGCLCGEVLKGRIIPPQCPSFDTKCNPQNPLGPCMVSFEGACSAYYKYERGTADVG